MKNLVIFLLMVFFTIPAFSQFDFRKAYIVTNQHDTILGLVDYRGNKANAQSCLFKKDENAATQELTPKDIMEYRFIDSKYYVKKKITIHNEEQDLFLEYIINGVVDVFYFRDNIGEHYYLCGLSLPKRIFKI